MIKAGFYQTNPVFGDKDHNINKALSAIKSAEADLIVLPEFFATGYQFTSMDEVEGLSEPIPDGETTREIIKLSAEKKGYIVAGIPEREDGKYYNSAIFTGPAGLIGIYRKTHLFLRKNFTLVPEIPGSRSGIQKSARSA
jgi:predicted amidohydrolase